MLSTLLLRLSEHRNFWRGRRLTQSAAFKARKQQFELGRRLHSTFDASRLFQRLVRATWLSFLGALSTATILLLTELYLPEPRIATWLPIPLWHVEMTDSYAPLLSTVAGIGGVLIALYYSGMIAAASAVYAKAPNDLRELVLREPLGKFFIQLVAYTTFLALCLLTFSALGFAPIRLVFPLLTLLSGVSILSFVHLGQEAFRLFDPTRLSSLIFRDLDVALSQACAPQRFYLDASFQWHAHRQADSALESLRILTAHALDDRYLKAGAIAEVAVSTAFFLRDYEAAKRTIPLKSRWYSTHYRHRDFFASDPMQVDLALRTGSIIPPELTQDEQWVEVSSLKIILEALASNINEPNHPEAIRIIHGLQQYIQQLCRSWKADQACELLRRIADLVLAPIQQTRTSTVVLEPIAAWEAALLEQLALLPIAALLTFSESVHATSLTTIDAEINRLDWHKPERIYNGAFPAAAMPALENLRSPMIFERQSEGQAVTPNWIVLQIISRDLLSAFYANISTLFKISTEAYQAWASSLQDLRELWGCAILISRHGEYLSKLARHLSGMLELEPRLLATRVLKDLEGWPDTKKSSFDDELQRARTTHAQFVAKLASDLSQEITPSFLPDLAGQFFAQTSQYLVRLLLNSDFEDFLKSFPNLWTAAFGQAHALLDLSTITEKDSTFRVRLGAAPLLDLIEITGLAIMMSELFETPAPWGNVQPLWDGYLTAPEAGPLRIALITDVLQTANTPMMLAPGDMPRNEWGMQAEDVIRKRLGLESRDDFFYFDRRQKPPVHSRPLIRVLARSPIPGRISGADIFGVMYFSQFLKTDSDRRLASFHDLRDQLRVDARRANARTDEEGDEDDYSEFL